MPEMWNYTELRRFCEQRSLGDSSIYQVSLEVRRRIADYHATCAKRARLELFTRPFVLGDEWWSEHELAYEAHVEACVHSLHSMLDLLAQILNVCVLNSRIPESSVSARAVLNEMSRSAQPDVALQRLRELLDHRSVRYVDGFCNTIKHRRLIEARFHAEFGPETENRMDFRFVAFVYNGVQYPAAWGNDIADGMREDLRRLIVGVGVALNDSLR